MAASNEVITTATTRSDMGADTVLDGFLKDVYLDGVTDTIFFDDSFTRLIQPRTATLDATGRRIIQAFDVQRSGGVGAMSEGGDFRDSIPIDGAQGWEWMKYENMYFALSGPSIATVKQGEGSYVDIVAKHLSSIQRSEKMNIERILMGQGDGRLGEVQATPSTSVCNVTGPAFYDTQFMERGMVIEFRAPSLGAPIWRGITGTTTYHYTQITKVVKGNKRTSTTGSIECGADTGTSSVLLASGGTVAVNDWICRKNTYQTSTVCLETNGMMNLVSDGATNTGTYIGAESASNFVYVWNIDRTSSTYLTSQIVNINAELDEENLLEVIIENEHQYQSNPNLLIVSPRAMLKYFTNIKDDRRFNTMAAMNWVGGYTGLGIQLGSRQLMLTTLSSVPAGYAFLINTNDFAFMRPPGRNGFQWLTSEGGRVLRQKEGSDNQFATAVDYFSFVCTDPGKQAKLYGITE